MDASRINASYTHLYGAGLGILLWGYAEMDRQEEARIELYWPESRGESRKQ